MAICGIYKITSPSKKIYIGQAVNIKRRFYKYKSLDCKQQVILYKSFLKYGVEKHTFEIVEECDIEDLNCRERHWQDYYDVLNGGLNCVLQECGEKRRVLTEQTLKLMSEKSKGRVWSTEVREKSSKAKKGNKNPMYGKSGKNSPTYGRKHTEEDRLKIKKALLLKGDDWRIKNITEEHKQKISKSNSKEVEDTETGVIYKSAKEASEITGIKYSTLRCYLNGSIKNKTTLKYKQ